MKPEQVLKKTTSYLEEMRKAKKMVVKTGLPADKVGSKVYGDGMSVMRIGAIHEYGYPPIPQRSFLRMPFELKSADIGNFIKAEYVKVLESGSTAEKALGRIGVMTSNISKEAFRTNGFGLWPELAESTIKYKAKKGKSTPMVYSGILRGSITWSVQ